jgi:hypothetical protein
MVLLNFLQHQSDGDESLVELGLDLVGIDGEGDVGRHVEDDLIAHAADRDAGSLQLGAQFGFLLIHVVADGCSGQAADAGADERRNARDPRRCAEPMMAPATAPPPAPTTAPPVVFDICVLPVKGLIEVQALNDRAAATGNQNLGFHAVPREVWRLFSPRNAAAP